MSPRGVRSAAVVVATAVVSVAGLGATAVLAADRVRAVLADRTPLTPYKEPQWWLDYDAGFVRRGLPGEVLSWVAGGPPDRELVAAAGVGLTLAAVLAAVALAVLLARSAPTSRRAWLVATVGVASPLTVSLLLHDVGRYDGIGVLALALLALPLGWGRLPRWAVPVAVALVVAAATAAQELLLPVLAPVALARAGRAAALAPAAGVAAASALLPAPPSAVSEARAAAVAAGVPPQGGWGDALDAVERTLPENVAFFEFFTPAALAGSALLWAGVYAATVPVLARLLGREDDRTWWVLAAVHAAVAAGLSLLGVDFRRWWGLALLGLVAAAAVTRPGPVTAAPAGPHPAMGAATSPRPGPADSGLRLVTAVGALVALGLWAADLPVFPVAPVG